MLWEPEEVSDDEEPSLHATIVYMQYKWLYL